MIPPVPTWLGEGSRARRVTQGIAILWLLSLSDLFFTLWAHTFTPFDELNPIAAALLDQGFFGILVTVKLGLTFIGASIFWYLRGHGRAEIAMWAVVLAYLLLAIRWSSYTAGVMALAGAAV
jgi:uncharacterized protein DUF5658